MQKVSIITATFNSANTVAETLQSVKQQSYPVIEHIIVDGLSTDNTIQIAQSFQHIQSIISEKDKGIYDAMNKGIKIANGDIIGILNSDDFYSADNIIEKVVETFNQHNCDAVYGDLFYVDSANVSKVKRKWKAGFYKNGSFLQGWMPPHPTFFVRKKIYEQYGLFNTSLGTAADYELMLRLVHKYHIKIAYLKEVLVHMRTGGASNKTIIRRLAANKNDRLAWKVNNLQPYLHTLYLKPFRKITQFLNW